MSRIANVKKLAFLLAILISLTACAQSNPPVTKVKNVTIAFGGDTHGVDQISTYLNSGGNPLKNVSKALKSADIAVLNLESAVTTSTEHQEKEFVFNSNPYLLDWMKTEGVDIVNVGNNHAGDYLRAGFVDTLKNLNDRGFQIIGGGETGRDAWTAKIIEVRGTKIAFLGIAKVNSGVPTVASAELSGTTDGWDPKVIELAIKAADRRADAVIIYTHWGVEAKNCPSKSEVTDANLWLSWGATAVIGSHPHRQQPFILKDGKLIDYSLGNFIFHSNNSDGQKSGVGILSISPEGKAVKYVFKPALINGRTGAPSFIYGAAKDKAKKEKNRFCASLNN